MNVCLPAELEVFVGDLIRRGLFASFEEVVELALDLFRDRFEPLVIEEARLRQLVQIGLEQADRGELVDGEEVFRQFREGMNRDKEADEETFKREPLRALIAIGIEQLERGEGVPLDMEAIKAKVAARLAAKGSV